MAGRFVTTGLAALLAAACGAQSGNSQDALKPDPTVQDRLPALDPCVVARSPERFDGQRVTLNALVIQDIEFAYLTSPHCMWRGWDGKVGLDHRNEWDFSVTGPVVSEARRRSTATRSFAAEAEFEGVVRAQRRVAPRNETGPAPEFEAMFQIESMNHLRLVEIPMEQRP